MAGSKKSKSLSSLLSAADFAETKGLSKRLHLWLSKKWPNEKHSADEWTILFQGAGLIQETNSNSSEQSK